MQIEAAAAVGMHLNESWRNDGVAGVDDGGGLGAVTGADLRRFRLTRCGASGQDVCALHRYIALRKFCHSIYQTGAV